MYEVEGLIHHVGEVETFKNNFTKRKVVISKSNGDRTDFTVLTLIKEKCDFVNPSDVGKPVKAKFFVNGNEYQGKWYVDLNCMYFDVQKNDKATPPKSSSPRDTALPPDVEAKMKNSSAANEDFLNQDSPVVEDKYEDDLPF